MLRDESSVLNGLRYNVEPEKIQRLAEMVRAPREKDYEALSDLKILFARLCFCENVMQEITKRLNGATRPDPVDCLAPLFDDNTLNREMCLTLGLEKYDNYLQNLEWNKQEPGVDALPFFLEWFYEIRDTLLKKLNQILEFKKICHCTKLETLTEFLESLKNEVENRSDLIGEGFYRCIHRAFPGLDCGGYRSAARGVQTCDMMGVLFGQVVTALLKPVIDSSIE
jgi:hypothetical protein